MAVLYQSVSPERSSSFCDLPAGKSSKEDFMIGLADFILILGTVVIGFWVPLGNGSRWKL